MSVILMTAQASLQSAMRAVNEGAYYYIQKPFSNDELLAICSRAAEARALRVENRALKQEIKRRDGAGPERPVGQSRSFTKILDLVETVAPTDSTILITGESGTGKEVRREGRRSGAAGARGQVSLKGQGARALPRLRTRTRGRRG